MSINICISVIKLTAYLFLRTVLRTRCISTCITDNWTVFWHNGTLTLQTTCCLSRRWFVSQIWASATSGRWTNSVSAYQSTSTVCLWDLTAASSRRAHQTQSAQWPSQWPCSRLSDHAHLDSPAALRLRRLLAVALSDNCRCTEISTSYSVVVVKYGNIVHCHRLLLYHPWSRRRCCHYLLPCGVSSSSARSNTWREVPVIRCVEISSLWL